MQGSAGDGGDGVGLRGRGGRIGIGPDPGLREDVADIVIGDGLRGPADDGRLSEAVEDIVGEGLEDVGDDVAARGEIADRIEGEGEIGDGVRDAGGDRGDEAAVLVEGPVGDDAVAGGLLEDAQLRVEDVGGPVGLARGVVFQLLGIAERGVEIFGGEAGGIGDGVEAQRLCGEVAAVDVAITRS